jgi:hypothetical protein
MPDDDERVDSDRPAASGCRVAELITLQRGLIAAGDRPRPFMALDTVIRKETPRCLVGGSVNDEVRRTGHDFVITIGADDFERQRIIVRPSTAGDQRPSSELALQVLVLQVDRSEIAVNNLHGDLPTRPQLREQASETPKQRTARGRVWPRRI